MPLYGLFGPSGPSEGPFTEIPHFVFQGSLQGVYTYPSAPGPEAFRKILVAWLVGYLKILLPWLVATSGLLNR